MQKIQDPILQQAIDQIDEKIPAANKADYLKIVVAGLKMLFQGASHQHLINAMAAAKQDPQKLLPGAVKGTIGIIGVIYKESQGKMKIPLAVPAGIVILCYILDFAEQSTGQKIEPDTLATLTHAVALGILKMFHIDQQKLQMGADHLRAQNGQEPAPPDAGADEGAPEATPPAAPGGTPPPATPGPPPTGMVGAAAPQGV